MSAIVVIQHRAPVPAVHALTDARAVGLEGRQFDMPKIWALPHMNAVFFASGAAVVGPLALQWLCEAASGYEMARAMLPPLAAKVQEFLTASAPLMKMPDLDKFNLVLAGLDYDGMPDAALVANHPIGGSAPFSIVRLGGLSLLPCDPGTLEGMWLPDQAEDVDPVADGLMLMEAQRRTSPHLVGGHCQLTTVRATGIETKIVARWRDDMGMPPLLQRGGR